MCCFCDIFCSGPAKSDKYFYLSVWYLYSEFLKISTCPYRLWDNLGNMDNWFCRPCCLGPDLQMSGIGPLKKNNSVVWLSFIISWFTRCCTNRFTSDFRRWHFGVFGVQTNVYSSNLLVLHLIIVNISNKLVLVVLYETKMAKVCYSPKIVCQITNNNYYWWTGERNET